MQKELLICETPAPSPTSIIFGWSYTNVMFPEEEELDQYPSSIIEAIQQGWVMIGTPQLTSENVYVWWLTKV